MSSPSFGQVTRENLWLNNPVLIQVLGICSTLAVTNLVSNTLIMTVGVSLVIAFSNLTLSLIRHLIPRSVRMIQQVLVISLYVIILQLCLQVVLPETARNLGPYVGLIITNCIVMGRTETFAPNNPPIISWWDGFTSGLGYMAPLLLLAVIREPLGFGTMLGYPLFPKEYVSGGNNWTIMIMAPSAFFLAAVMLWIFKTNLLKREAAEQAKLAARYQSPVSAGGQK